MKKIIAGLLTAVVLLAGCNGGAQEAEEVAEPLPENLANAIGYKWRHMKKVPNGLQFIEIIYYEDFLVLNNDNFTPRWDTIHFDLQNDTLITYRIDKEGDFVLTNDRQKITRVTRSTMDLQMIRANKEDLFFEFDLVTD